MARQIPTAVKKHEGSPPACFYFAISVKSLGNIFPKGPDTDTAPEAVFCLQSLIRKGESYVSCNSGAQWVSLEVWHILRPPSVLPTSRLPVHRVVLIRSHGRGVVGGCWNEPLLRVSLILDGMSTFRRSLYSSAPAPSGGMRGSCMMLCPVMMDMAVKRAGMQSDAQAACAHQQLCVRSLFIC